MIKKTLSIILAVSFLALTPLNSFAADSSTTKIKKTTEFKDVLRTHDFYVAIKYLQDKGIIGGYADGFRLRSLRIAGFPTSGTINKILVSN